MVTFLASLRTTIGYVYDGIEHVLYDLWIRKGLALLNKPIGGGWEFGFSNHYFDQVEGGEVFFP